MPYVPYYDMPRTVTYVGAPGALFDVHEQQLAGGFFKRLRKIRPSKWKPKDFAKAAAIVGGAVILGPAAVGLAAKGATLAARSIKGGLPKSSPTVNPLKYGPGLVTAGRVLQTLGPLGVSSVPQPSEALKYETETPRPASAGSSAVPLIAIAALLLLGNRKG